MYRIVTYGDYKAVNVNPETRCAGQCIIFSREVPPRIILNCDIYACKGVDRLELSEWVYNNILMEGKQHA